MTWGQRDRVLAALSFKRKRREGGKDGEKGESGKGRKKEKEGKGKEMREEEK